MLSNVSLVFVSTCAVHPVFARGRVFEAGPGEFCATRTLYMLYLHVERLQQIYSCRTTVQKLLLLAGRFWTEE